MTGNGAARNHHLLENPCWTRLSAEIGGIGECSHCPSSVIRGCENPAEAAPDKGFNQQVFSFASLAIGFTAYAVGCIPLPLCGWERLMPGNDRSLVERFSFYEISMVSSTKTLSSSELFNSNEFVRVAFPFSTEVIT